MTKMGRFGRFGTYITLDSAVAYEWNNEVRYRCDRGPAVKAVEEH